MTTDELDALRNPDDFCPRCGQFRILCGYVPAKATEPSENGTCTQNLSERDIPDYKPADQGRIHGDYWQNLDVEF